MKNTLLVLFVVVMFASCTTDGVETEIENSIQKTAAPAPLPPNSELIKIRYEKDFDEERKAIIRARFFGTCERPFVMINGCGVTQEFAISLYPNLPITAYTEYWLATYCSNKDFGSCGGGLGGVISDDDDIELEDNPEPLTD